jgi:uncharacterized NAD(P)/FAD-binding protein YdhS
MKYYDVAIIGAGFTGTMAAVNMLRQKRERPIKIALVESKALVGLGLAYSTKQDFHRLNVQAGNMSAFNEERDHFLNYLANYGDQSASWSSYISRSIYGSYLQHTLEEERSKSESLALDIINDTVFDIDKSDGQFTCLGEKGALFTAKNIVLALGNPPPSVPNTVARDLKGNTSLIIDPWDSAAVSTIKTHDYVLFIGTGLTTVDKILELVESGHKGRLTALSRRGLLPQPHEEEWLVNGAPEISPPPAGMDVLSAFKWVRANIKDYPNWRLLIDGLRKYSNDWWQSLTVDDKRRFLRHVQSYWDSHRHRTAPEVGKQIAALVANGRLTVIAARIATCRNEQGRIAVVLQPRRQGKKKLLIVDKIVNCTGPNTRLDKIDLPLIRNLFAKGVISSNELGNGLKVDEDFNIVDSRGKSNNAIKAIGPLLRGTFFETVAVPELRWQAAALATSAVFCP